MGQTPRPLRAEPAFDGMDLEPALRELWGRLPDDATLLKLKGDASTRSYYRLASGSHAPSSAVVMRLPADALKSDEITDGTRPTELPFLNVQRHLKGLGVRVPEVWVDHTPRGVIVLEDLGDETFEERLLKTPEAGWQALYERAIDVLAALHARASAPNADCIAYTRSFDRALLRWELQHFQEWGLEALQLGLSDDEQRVMAHSFDALVDALLALPQGFVHRDYQSRNLMWAPERDELVVIDFQDALLGPAVYDLVALLCDSYVNLSEALQRRLIAHYAALRGQSAASLEQAFWLVAAQRKLKDAGRFVFIDQVRANPSFLPWYAPSLRYVGRALTHLPEFSRLGALLVRKVAGFPDAVWTPRPNTGSRRGG